MGGEEGVRVFPYNTVAGQITDLLRETVRKVWVREREGGRENLLAILGLSLATTSVKSGDKLHPVVHCMGGDTVLIHFPRSTNKL